MTPRTGRIPPRLEHLTPLDGLVFALAAGAIAAAGFGIEGPLAFVAAAFVAAVARLALTVRDGRAFAALLRRGERIDPMTGLGNRHALLEALDRELGPEADGPVMLGVFTLDGLQHYNESFGGLAGDALVRRLAQRLQDTVEPAGRAFRPAGGRFAVIERVGRAGFGPLLSAATAALSEDGDGFCIDALAGVVLLPDEADTPEHALLVADQRLMARRADRESQPPPSLRRLVSDAIARRQAPLTTDGPTLGTLARSTATRLGLRDDQAARAALTAELQAIGKLAVPREILAKPGPLDASEWEFVEQQAAVGERLVRVAVEAPDVGALVRASHERYDGSGYPDGLAGDAIPIEARIAAVCGAYEAMLMPRPHRPARSSAEALDELARNAGTQFDPDVVGAFRLAVAQAMSAAGVREGRLPAPTPVEG